MLLTQQLILHAAGAAFDAADAATDLYTLLAQLLMLLTQQLILHAATPHALHAATQHMLYTLQHNTCFTHALHAADSVRNYPYHYQRLPRPVELAN
jgi:hypothetical protein